MLIPLQDHLYRLDTPFLGVPLSLYVITGEQTVLIDSGISTTPEEFIFPALDAAGLTPDLLICTHGHVDHFGGNAALRQRYPAMKIALQAGRRALGGRSRATPARDVYVYAATVAVERSRAPSSNCAAKTARLTCICTMVRHSTWAAFISV